MALLGANGVGKSTTVQVAGGRLVPKSGCVHVAGTHVNGAAPGDMAKAGVCTVPEGRGIFPNLTVDENLWLMTNVGRGARNEIRERAFHYFPRLGERRNQLAGTMSGGEQQMLAMSRALAVNPAVLLLDELSMGLAPLIVGQLYEIVKQIADEGVSILVVEQFATAVLGIADVAAIMLHGEITSIGAPSDIEAELSKAYLGG